MFSNGYDSAAPETQIGYCTNVHPGRDLVSIGQNLRDYCIPIRQQISPNGQLGIGLWFSEDSALEALAGNNAAHLKHSLEKNGLVAFTLNGFPQGDFHSQIVKHRVYEPTWWQASRLEYTKNLIHVLDGLLPSGHVGSISTLPISWSSPNPSQRQLEMAASNLLEIALKLHALFETTGREMVLAVEPEPGCYLTDSASFRRFYERYLSTPYLSNANAAIARKYLTLCHDICHAAVMFEDQHFELNELFRNGLRIGKVQVSSAVEVDWSSMDPTSIGRASEQLSLFAENRYLHQTVVQSTDNRITFYEDLSLALAGSAREGRWRVHFHVPIFLESMGLLKSTQSEIQKTLQILQNNPAAKHAFTGHFEVETYAWGVLPEAMRDAGLVAGIAHEIEWIREIANRIQSFPA